MEQQFILRLPESLRNFDPKDYKLAKTTQKQVMLHIKDKAYPGIICKLPTIVETQKCIDSKLYKIADVSTLVVIYENNDFVLEDEIRKHERSGLTPPMHYAKERRFNTTSIKTEEVEEIERKVAELLKEDSKAVRVEVVTNEKDSSDIDLDLLAAEIESEMPLVKEGPQNIPTLQDKRIVSAGPMMQEYDMKERHATESPQLDRQIANILDGAIGPIAELSPSKVVDLPIKERYNIPISPIPEPIVPLEQKPDEPIYEEKPMPSKDEAIHPELIDLESRIKEKEDLLNKAVNPILKKRFEQAITELRSEYEKRKTSLEKSDQ